jgi:hypothetical protein
VGPTSSLPGIVGELSGLGLCPSCAGLGGTCIPISKDDPRAGWFCKAFGVTCCEPSPDAASQPWYYKPAGMVGIGVGILGASALVFYAVKKRR